MTRGALLLLVPVLLLTACSGLRAPHPAPAADAPRVLVVLPPGPPSLWRRHAVQLAAAHGLYVYDAWEMELLHAPCIVYGLPAGESLERIVSRLRGDPRVELAQPVQDFRLLGETAPAPGGDPYAHLQHGANALHAPQAHRWATGRGVKVALIDTGVDVGHPDLAGRVVKAANFVDRGARGSRGFSGDVHGTAVAGVVAAVADNGLGIAGVAPDAELLAYKACWPRSPRRDDAACNSYTLALAVDAAASGGARVLNLSLTGPEDPLLGRLLTTAMEHGAAVVAAVDAAAPDLGFPASLPGVIAVRAGDDPHQLPLGPAAGRSPPPLLAPGTDVLTTVPGGGYDFFSGSSMAAAHVSGLAALLLERAPELTPPELARRLADSARPVETTGDGAAAIVDACRAVTTLLELPDGCPGPLRRAR